MNQLLSQIDIFALALASIAFVPGYLAGLKLRHQHAPPLCGCVAAFVVYLAARILLMIFMWVVVPAALLWCYRRFHQDLSGVWQTFSVESGIRVRELRRPPHVNDAIDRLLTRRESVAEELSLLKASGKPSRHVESRLRQEIDTLDQTLRDLL